ncbi:MAG: hypothetical protein EXQ74_02870 [Thermoleophilia bacterium]|nr:hypothetical protein [Thermoleophilia bacterium]
MFALPFPVVFGAHHDSTSARAKRKAVQEAKDKEQRRYDMIEALRRAKSAADDPAEIAKRERARRHSDVLDRWPANW